ncbi:MAG: hypothetical protein HOK55_11315 [Gammaproteobacteria bacterium]|nr:hypothetical protein [Gammaproteobacteria bacterium]
MNTSDRLDQYLDAFKQRLRKLTLLQGLAATVVVLLVLSVIGAWFSTESGFAGDTVAAFRIILVLAVAAVIITRIIRPLQDLDADISSKVEERSPDFGGRIETYMQMRESNNPFRDLLAEDALQVSDSHPVRQEINQRDFAIASAIGGTALVVLLILLVAGPGMMNYSLRNLFAGWAFDDLLPPQSITVTPGDQSVRLGANLRVMAVMEGFTPDDAVIHVRGTGGQWQDVEMVKSPAGFEFTFFSLQENMNYFITTTGIRSPEYTIQVVEVPGIESLELTYNYPEWTERDPETFELGDIRTLPDTRIELKITTTAPLPDGELVLNETGQGLSVDGVEATTEFMVTDEGEYYIAAIVGGEQVRLSDDYFIRIAEDGKPVIEFIRPGGDWNASNIEEVTARIEASDDFNLEALTLKYSVNGGDWQSVSLAENIRDITAEHIFMLEDIRVPEEEIVETNVGAFTVVTSEEERIQKSEDDYINLMIGSDDSEAPAPAEVPLVPGDLISFYAEGNDRTQTVRTDMFFIQIQSYARRYSQSQLSGGGGGGGGGGPQDEISNRQRQIITSTWNLIREQAEDASAGQVQVNSTLLSELQTTLAEQAATLAQRTRARQLDNMDEQIEQFVTNMEQAVQNMYPASERLAAIELDEAIQPAQEALQHLLRAEAVFNEFQVNNQQGGGGGGGRAQQDLAEMFELEMDLELNQYETGSNASPQAQQAEKEDIMDQLDELSRRQQQLANNLRNEQQISEAQRYQQEMLRREAQELQDRLEELQQQRESLQRGQGQQTSQNQPPQGEQSGQQGQQGGQPGQPGQQGQQSNQEGQQGEQQGEQVAQSELQRRLDSAIRAMEQSAEAMRNNGSAEERQQAADEAGRQLEGAREQIAADQLADMQSSFSNMADQAERMLREQQRQEQVLEQAMAKAVEERESGEDPNSRGMELQEEWQLAREKAELAADLSSLQEQMLSSMQRFGDEVPNASRELQQANQEIVESELEQALTNAGLYIDAGYALYIAGNESAVTAEMRKLADSLDDAQEMVLTQGAPGTSDLEVAQRQAQALRAQLQEQLAQNPQPGQSGQEGQEGQQGQQNQQGQQGQQEGQQQGGGNSGGDRFALGPRFGAWNGVDPLNNGPIDLPDQFYGNLDQFTDIARDAVQDLELNTEELAQMLDWIRQLEATRLNRNEAILAGEYNDMLALIEQLEVGLQLDNDSNNPNNVRTATQDLIPDEYKESVAEYFRRLSRE